MITNFNSAKRLIYNHFSKLLFAKESVFFFTLHKCASTLFSNFILKNVRGLHNIDYASKIYINKDVKFNFKEFGFIYGPIRLSTDITSPVRELVNITTQPKFINDKKSIFHIRDPRDILVSTYYSFGFSHGYSPSPVIKEIQINRRQEIKSMSIDDYAIKKCQLLKENFNSVYHLTNICNRGVLVKYEDMINNFDEYMNILKTYLDFSPKVMKQIYLKSRPKITENIHSHRRLGKTNSFRDHLKKNTIDRLNEELCEILNNFRYEL